MACHLGILALTLNKILQFDLTSLDRYAVEGGILYHSSSATPLFDSF